MPSVTVTFFKATFVRISVVTNPILTKIFDLPFSDLIFFGQKFCLTQTFLDIKILRTQHFFEPTIILEPNSVDLKFLGLDFSRGKILLTEIFFGLKNHQYNSRVSNVHVLHNPFFLCQC